MSPHQCGLWFRYDVVGPKNPYSLVASHTLTDNGGFQRLSVHMTANRPGDFSPASGAHSGLFTSSSVATTALPTDSSDVVIWDRVPAQDLKEMELPSKVCTDLYILTFSLYLLSNRHDRFHPWVCVAGGMVRLS